MEKLKLVHTMQLDAGMMDASELLNSIEEHILKAKEEAFSRREILDKMEKWMSACEEEGWLEDYNKVCHIKIQTLKCQKRDVLVPLDAYKLIHEISQHFYQP